LEEKAMTGPTCPLDTKQAVDLYFMEHRAKLLDIAAFLDRLQRTSGGDPSADVRIRGLERAIPLLVDGHGDRVRRMLELFSDHSSEPIPAAHTQSAIGVDPQGDY
jgi:hypothetical protein